jgi:hypothetical protein
VAPWPPEEPVLPREAKPLPAFTTLRMPMAAEPKMRGQWFLILFGVTTLFGLVIGGNYWLNARDWTSGSVEVAQSPSPPAEPTPTATAAPIPAPAPQLAVGLQAVGSQPVSPDRTATAPETPQLEAAPGQSPTLVDGLGSIVEPPPPIPPAPVIETPVTSEAPNSIAQPVSPARKHSAPRPPSGAPPARSPAIVKF